MEAQVAQLASSAGLDAQCSAAARIREALCSRNPPVQALLDAGLAAPLVRLVKEGPAAARVDAAWALVNIAASSEYVHPEALCNESAAEVLVEVLNVGKQRLSTAGGSNSSGAASTSRGDGGALAELSLWALGNIAGAMHPGMRTQALAVDVLDAGALRAVIAVMEQEAAAPGMSAAVASPLLRVATWCLHNLAKHKREKEMVDAIPVVTKLLTEAADTEVLTCAAWVLAFLGSNEDNKSHMKQALPALPRLVQWVREASSSLATPSLLSVGTMCTGYMRALDYSEQVVEAGGVPAMLSYLQRAAAGGLAAARRAMVKEALFALSNVAGANCGTVRAMLDAGVFPAVIDLLRQASGDDEILNECLYVLTNPWDPLVGADVPTSRALVDSGILQELHSLLDPAAPAERLSLLLKGLGDGLKRGQQLMTYEANMRLVEHGPEAAASMPAVQNPVVTLYVQLGTVQRIGALNSHTDEEVHTRANGMITVLRFFME
ncbi:hypothetical protein HYH02_014984 [Chlamydomonas schloesseri]|uniref:Importin subunit alpha n=1 Tax=Chlamydomonas schloesseri TaxID=2026947 RepID=A0A835SRS9_9CHLO|nr:hypothetical protein HYH02_014984 [Chlamydomonas schloesseri]|eukprot:KAG2425610.1 hypothetical protein HYH02_014984 [Chlamydomonas schloesseri]